MPIDSKRGFPILPAFGKADLSQFTGVNGLPIDSKALIGNSQFPEAIRQLKTHFVMEVSMVQFGFDLEPHRHNLASASEVTWLNKLANAICPSRNSLENLKRTPNGSLARTVFSYQQDGTQS